MKEGAQTNLVIMVYSYENVEEKIQLLGVLTCMDVWQDQYHPFKLVLLHRICMHKGQNQEYYFQFPK